MSPARRLAGAGAMGGSAAHGRLFAFLALVAVSLGPLCWASPASAERPLDTGFADDALYQSADPATRSKWFDETVTSRSDVVRVNVLWRGITSGEPTDPRDPADPAYNFSGIDGAEADAQSRGLQILMTFYSAPNYAEGADPPGSVPDGTWKPNPGEVEDFAFALASRYPGVEYFQAWNEPDLSTYLTPQFAGSKPTSPGIYKGILNAAFKGVNDAGNAKVVTAGTAPYGDPPGGNRMRPLVFWRKLFCLRDRRRLVPRDCAEKPRLDVFAHHPINTTGGPHLSAAHPDNASTPDFKNVVRILRKAEQAGNAPGGHHPAWATELWWESNPPDESQGVPEAKHARWLEEALYVLWKQGARVVINLQIRDDEFNEQTAFLRNTTGIFFHSGEKKPAFRAWRFPFVTHRRSDKRINAWGKAPAAGALQIQRQRNGGWHTLEQFHVGAGKVFSKRVNLDGAAKLRARVGATTSLTWNQSS